MKEIIDRMKILDLALENAKRCKTSIATTEELLYGLKIEEKLLMVGLTYIILMSKAAHLPEEIVKGLMTTINNECQHFAEDIQRYREYSARQIDLIRPTEMLRSKFTNQINSGRLDEALTSACELLDIYEFGIANSEINQNILKKARKKYGDIQMD